MIRIMAVLAAGLAAAACAQVPPVAAPAPGAAMPAGAAYRSALEGYRPFRADEPPKDWREANEEVRAAGGHAGLVKEGAKP